MRSATRGAGNWILRTAVLLSGVLLPMRGSAPAIAGPRHSLKRETEARIPFTFDRVRQPSLIVRAMIDGQGPYRFALDTGFAGSILLDAPTADRLSLGRGGQAGCGLHRVDLLTLSGAHWKLCDRNAGLIVSDLSRFKIRYGAAPVA